MTQLSQKESFCLSKATKQGGTALQLKSPCKLLRSDSWDFARVFICLEEVNYMSVEQFYSTDADILLQVRRREKLAQLQNERQRILDRYFESCEKDGKEQDVNFLMENFGADLEFIDDEYLDGLIARDDASIQAGKPKEKYQLYRLPDDEK